ncbi:hypothetical protein VTI74DRAFT_2008 [Chaetomium olivicolor]
MESFSNFHTSAKDIRIKEGHILAAHLYDPHDERSYYTSIDLNHFIGNIDGRFTWGGENFAESAENISLALEGPDSVPVLHAGLKNSSGVLVDAKLNLSEHIGNRDASFLVDPEFQLHRPQS